MADKYKALRDALEAGPTPGPWFSNQKNEIGPISKEDDQSFGMLLPVSYADSDNAVNNRNYIAAANPETILALLAERDRLLQACETALSYVEAVCFNTPNDKKRRNYADCAAKIRAAMGEDEGEQDES